MSNSPTSSRPAGPASADERHASRALLLATLLAAAAAGAGMQQVVKRESQALGMSSLELHIVLGIVGAATGRLVSVALARRSGRAAD